MKIQRISKRMILFTMLTVLVASIITDVVHTPAVHAATKSSQCADPVCGLWGIQVNWGRSDNWSTIYPTFVPGVDQNNGVVTYDGRGLIKNEPVWVRGISGPTLFWQFNPDTNELAFTTNTFNGGSVSHSYTFDVILSKDTRTTDLIANVGKVTANDGSVGTWGGHRIKKLPSDITSSPDTTADNPYVDPGVLEATIDGVTQNQIPIITADNLCPVDENGTPVDGCSTNGDA